MRRSFTYFLFFILLLVLFFLDLALGSTFIPFSKVLQVFNQNGGVTETIVVLGFRLPKAIAAISAGMALSVAGMLMQTFFRNPLAGPYVLGVNSMASLSVAAMMMGIGQTTLLAKVGTPIVASIGSMIGLFILLILSKRVKSNIHLLMVGMMIGFLSGALESVLEYLSSAQQVKNFIIWNMASLSGVTGYDLLLFFAVSLFISLSCLFLIKPLNAMLLGAEHATLLGVNVKVTRVFILIATAVLSGVTTAYCGPVGFVGLAMPFMVRLLFKTTDHLHLLFGCMLCGASFMLVCDIISNLPVFENTLPVNVITSLFGTPFILWLIFRSKVNFD